MTTKFAIYFYRIKVNSDSFSHMVTHHNLKKVSIPLKPGSLSFFLISVILTGLPLSVDKTSLCLMKLLPLKTKLLLLLVGILNKNLTFTDTDVIHSILFALPTYQILKTDNIWNVSVYYKSYISVIIS